MNRRRARLAAPDFGLGLEPIGEVVTVFSAALFEKQVSANTDLFFDVFDVMCLSGIGWNERGAHKYLRKNSN